MNRKTFLRVIVASLLLAAGLVSLEGSPVGAFAGGTGTTLDPYQISTCAELMSIDDTTANLGKSYVLSSNIDCGSTTVTPMLNGSTYFSGSLDGANRTISNMSITCISGFSCALFVAASGTAEFKNLVFDAPHIDSSNAVSGATPINTYSGVLVGYSGTSANPSFSGITINGGSVNAGTGKASGSPGAGSVAGKISRGTVTNLSSSATVTGGQMVGGLVGNLGDQNTSCVSNSPMMTGSSFSGVVNGSKYVGGLVGEFGPNAGMGNCKIRTSSNTGTVHGVIGGSEVACSIIGGIVGELWEGSVENSSNTGRIDGGTNSCTDLGGIVGWARGNSLTYPSSESFSLDSVYSMSSVSGASRVGGVAGQCDRGALSNSFAIGAVNATTLYGSGLAAWSACVVTNSYARGTVTGAASYLGGLAGGLSYYGITNSYSAVSSGTSVKGVAGLISAQFPASCTDAYWDSTVGGSTTVCGATGKTTANMKTSSTFTNWDFTTVWAIDPLINSGYPYLSAYGTSAGDSALPTASWTSPSSPTASMTSTFTLTFSENVTSLDASDFQLSGTATGCSATPASSSASPSVAVSVTCSSTGDVTVALNAGAAMDTSLNAGPAAGVTSATLTIAAAVTTTTSVTTTTVPVTTTTVPATTTTVAMASTTTVAVGQAAATTTTSTSTVAPASPTTTVATAAAGSGSSSAQVDGDLVSVVSDDLQIVGTYGTVASSDGGTFGVARNGSITLKLWTGYIGTASGSVKVAYKAAGKSKSWSCTIKSTKVGKVNKNAKRTSGNWFPKKMLPVYSKCVLPAEARVSLKTTKAVITAKVRFVKWWPTTGKPINDITKARIPVGNRTLRIVIGN